MFADGGKSYFRRLSMHLDNCHVRPSKASSIVFRGKDIIRVQFLAPRPDLPLSDFWLFVHMKGAFTGQSFHGRGDHLHAVHAFLDEIQRSELKLVFHH